MFGITGDWKATALEAEVWVETVAEGGRRGSWPRGGKKRWTRLNISPGEERGSKTGKVVIVHGSVESCEATPIGPADETKESLCRRETEGDQRSA